MDVMVCHYSCSKLINWTSEGSIQGKVTSFTHSKFQHVDAAFYTCICKSIACSGLSDSGGKGTRKSKRNRAGSAARYLLLVLISSPPLSERLEV